MINIFLFSFHEQFWAQLVKWPSFLLPTSLCLACLITLKKFSALQVMGSVLAAVFACALLVILNKDGPRMVLLDVFGIQLPVFSLITLLALPVVLAFLAFEIFSRYSVFSRTAAFLLLILLVATNIELLNGISSSIVRGQDYETLSGAASFILGSTAAMTSVLLLPPLLAGACHQRFPTGKRWIITYICFAVAALGSVWLCQVYLMRILRNVAMLYL